MRDISRRGALRLLGAAAAVGSIGTASAAPTGPPKKGTIRRLGHSRLSDPPGGYAEEDIRADGQYGLLGSYLGEGGSFLVDLSNPTDPREAHRLPSASEIRNADVAFDPRDGLYYRTQEPNGDGVDFAGVEVVDYGFGEATADDPEIVASLDTGPTHNVFPHPEAPILYATNEAPGTSDGAAAGVDVWDVSDPYAPEFLGADGLAGGLHDFYVDTERDFLHAAYIFAAEGEFEGYAIFDISDPANLETVGTFDYSTAPDYTAIGEPGFELCHYAAPDPERDLAVVGDEKGTGIPGGKHVFDIGFDEGSPQNPVPVGFTHSPDAERQDEGLTELFDWTTHNHQVVPKDDTTLLVSGDYHEGLVVYDVTDPTDPTPTAEYETDDGSDVNNNLLGIGEPPFAWGANYSAERDLVFVSDFVTGAWTFKVTPSAAGTRGDGRGGR